MTVEGLMSVEKVINCHGEIRIADLESKHDLVVDFDTEADQRSTGIMGFFSRTPKLTETGGQMHRRDLVSLTIRKTIGYSEQIVAQAKGSFLEQITYEGDDAPFWTINDDISRTSWVEVEPQLLLQSDSSLRGDARHI